MFELKGKRGAWVNQYAIPAPDLFMERVKEVDYVIIKYGLGGIEKMAVEAGVPWLAEIYPYDNDPERYANLLADQSAQPGCVGVVVNFESGDGPGVAHWDGDDGRRTRLFIDTFKARNAAGLPIYASLDTRGYRATTPYQKELSRNCDGVMPMVYPKEFFQTVPVAFAVTVTPTVQLIWHGKEIIPTIQTYNGIGGNLVTQQLETAAKFDGVTAYTLGHATPEEWSAFIMSEPAAPSARESLLALRVDWYTMMCQLAINGNVDAVAAFAESWKKMASGK